MRRYLVVAAAFAAPAALSAQQTLLRLAPPSGQVSHYHIETTTGMDMAEGSIDANFFMRITSHVDSVAGDRYTVHTVVDSFRIDAPNLPMGAMPDLTGTATSVRMTTRARVLETVYSDSTLTAQFGGMAGSPGQSFPAGMTLPEEPVAPGYQWSDSSVIRPQAGPMGAVTVTTLSNYTFDHLERRAGARIAVVTIKGTITQTAAMMSSQGTLDGIMEFDLDAGRWVTNHMTVEMQTTAGAQQMTVTVRTTGRLVS